MRQFAIVDKNTGEALYLNGTITGNNMFLSSPSGLGFENKNSYEESDGFFVKTSSQWKQGTVKGTVVFFRNAYESYRDFVDFVAKIESLGHTLQLKYKPLEEWFNMDIDIQSVDKGQLTKARTLECGVKYLQLTPWYSISELHSSISGASESGIKTYSFTYSTKYPTSGASGAVVIQLDAQLSSAFEATLYSSSGTISAPVITATDESGTVIGKIDLSATGTTSALDTIEYSSVPNESGIWMNSEDIIDELNLSSAPAFFRIPPNKNITFTITATSLTGVNVDFKFHKYYRSV